MLGQVLILDLDYIFSWGLLVETKFTGKIMLGMVLIVDLDYFFSCGLFVGTNLSQQISQFKLMLGLVMTILDLS